MNESSKCKRLRIEARSQSKFNCDTHAANGKSNFTLQSVHMVHVFQYLSLINLAHCQQVTKLWLKNIRTALNSDVKQYAAFRVKQKYLDIAGCYLDSIILDRINCDVRTSDNDDTTDLIDSRIEMLVENERKLTNLLKKEYCVDYVIKNTITIVYKRKNNLFERRLTSFSELQDCKEFEYEDDTLNIHSENVPHLYRSLLTAAKLLQLAGLEKNDKMRSFVESDGKIKLYLSLTDYYSRILEREVMRIIFSNATVKKYLDLGTSTDNINYPKNLLLLDWDDTLYFSHLRRPPLIEFLKSATKYCVICINTAGGYLQHQVHQLNKNKGVHISGVLEISRRKEMLNQWIKRFHWYNIDETYFNFLLIDDLDQHCTNFLQVPPFKGNQDDDVLLKLIPWLKQWHQYTSVDKQGTTNQFIKSHPISFD